MELRKSERLKSFGHLEVEKPDGVELRFPDFNRNFTDNISLVLKVEIIQRQSFIFKCAVIALSCKGEMPDVTYELCFPFNKMGQNTLDFLTLYLTPVLLKLTPKRLLLLKHWFNLIYRSIL